MKANINSVNFDYIKKWEGGLSSDPRDPAAKNPCPTIKHKGLPLHTNTGVTWAAFRAHFPKKSEAEFLNISKADWLAIYERGYWAVMKCSDIDSQAVAELLADWCWMSGSYAGRGLQKVLTANGYPCVVDGIVGAATIKQLNAFIQHFGQKYVFEKLFAARMSFFQSLKGWKYYGAGWSNRMNEFKKYALSIL